MAWLAWRLKLPSILLLIIAGICLGPVFNVIDPDDLFGKLLNPIVSLAVAIILFEGGLGLNTAELKKIGKSVRGLLTVGVAVTMLGITLAAKYILKLDWSVSLLMGSLLVVTGPTVIGPMMRQIRPTGQLASVLKWEGIIIDPIGVTLAVLVFELIIIKEPLQVPLLTVLTVLKTGVYGGCLGYLFGWLLINVFKRNLVPLYLQNAVTLMFVILAFGVSNHLQAESGLLAVTVMGIMLASQHEIHIEHIVEFKENLQVLLIPAIFIILSSRIDLSDIESLNRDHLFFLLTLVFIVRPVAVILSTIGSGLPFKEKIFLSWMAPRGIVAAAMTSLFAIDLVTFGFENAHRLLPTVFLVIIGTVAIYGITAGPLAYILKLAEPNPQGIMFLGGHSWSRTLAKLLKDHGVKVLILDTNQENIQAAKQLELETCQVNVLAEHADEDLPLQGIGKLFALTPNQEVNSMAALRFAPSFGRDRVYQLSSEAKRSYKKKELSSEIRGRILFSSGVTFDYIQEQIETGAQIKAGKIDAEDIDNTGHVIQPLIIPLVLITGTGSVRVFASDNAPVLKVGEVLVYLDPAARNQMTETAAT